MTVENAKIGARQLFVLIVLLELGSAVILPTAMTAKQSAPIAILIGLLPGLFLFWVYAKIFAYYPDNSAPDYVQKTFGKVPGAILAFSYCCYYFYLAARITRDFGEMLVIIAYPETPLFVINALLLLVVVYAVRKGIETIARGAELLFIISVLIGLIIFTFVLLSGIFNIGNLQPYKEAGTAMRILKAAFFETALFPYGEVFAFVMIFPYLTKPELLKRTGFYAIISAGVILSLTMALNIGVLGADLTSRSNFPLLSTIQTIEFLGFIERLDVLFMVGVVIGGFIKITLFFYVSVTGLASLFKIKDSAQLVYPLGLVVLILSTAIASNLSEHLEEGFRIVPLYLHLPFQVIAPILILIITVWKNRERGPVIKFK